MPKIPHRARSQAGFTFAEVAMGLAVLVTIAAILINHVTINLQGTVAERDRVFAYGKAEAILAEIQGYVDRNSAGTDALDSLDDGIVPKAPLTIATDSGGSLLPPDHELSGNFARGGNWVWSRQITVQPFTGANNRNVRYVTVRIFRRDGNNNQLPIADLSAVINSAAAAYPTTQVFDLYLLAIENIPGWWVFMDSIRPFVESTITDLETRNPGLELRTHWITKASFGRSQAYRPYFNESQDSWQTIRNVYHYPSRMPAGNASTYYYVPDNVRARINLDGVETNGYDADLNPFPYALADYYNHAMRYPEELALWQQRVAAVEQREQEIAAALAASLPPPPELLDMSKEPTLRLFLEDLYSDPQRYQHAMIINLHGELLPVPALRNYADAAKDPVNLPEVRVVTHAEELRTWRDPAGLTTDDAWFRVYAYNTHEPSFTGSPIMPRPIAIEVLGLDLTDGSTAAPDLLPEVRLQNLRGGVMVDGTADYFPFASAKVEGDPSLASDEMYYRAEFVVPGGGAQPFTRILLFNTPCVAPPEPDDSAPLVIRGLYNDKRSQLYRMSYIPTCCEAARDFSRDLYTAGAGPKNTARWRFRVPAVAFDQPLFVDNNGNAFKPTDDVLLAVRTRIWIGGDPATSGTMWPPAQRNAPDNLSVTYSWWADSIEDVPITERSQFQGDPRHCPYRDLLNGDPDFPNGYNWYFDALVNAVENSAADYPALSTARLASRWRSAMNCDVPRLFEILRKGLVRSRCIYTTLTGWSYYYIGIGADVGYDADNGYPNSIPVELTPYGFTSAVGWVNMITGSRMLPRSGDADYWWGKPWLGELYADADSASTWFADDGFGHLVGNLPAGNTAGRYYLRAINLVHSSSTRQAYGTSMLASHQRTAAEGCTSFFNIGTSASTFHHRSSVGTGALTAIGTEIATNYNFNMPATAPISRPFHPATNLSGTVGNEFALTPYSAERYDASLLRLYYTHPSGHYGSGLVQLRDPTNSSAAYIVVNGIDRTVESGSTFIAKFAVLSLVHSYFESGSTTVLHRIKQPPRVEILAPTDISELNDPATIDIVVDVSWQRWDGLPYSQTGTYSETESELEYVVTYSNDGGTTWRYIQDDTVAEPGTRPDDTTYVLTDVAAGVETWSWAVPSGAFPRGSYLLRVDCYRNGAQIHFSYHKTKLFIQR